MSQAIAIDPSAPPAAFLEVRNGEQAVSRLALTGDHLLIGRAADVGMHLEGPTVSRHHAEVFRDPFGRWWVRDLGSRNGVRFHGRKVAELALQPGVTFHLGQYSLALRVPGSTDSSSAVPAPADAAQQTRAVVIDEDAVGVFRTIEETEASPRIAAQHLSTLMQFGRDLLEEDEPAARVAALCRLLVRTDFRGTGAVAFRLSRRDEGATPQILYGPVSAGPAEQPPPYLSRSLIRRLLEKNQPLLASNVRTGLPEAVELSISPETATISAVACPLRSDGDCMDAVYVTLPPQYGTAEWLAIASLAAEQYRLAEQAWLSRAHAQRHAAVERELEQARQIQMRLVPKDASAPGADVAIGFDPCHWVGGDYVDVVPTGDGRLLLAIADVCGKGMPAALVASSLRSMVRGTVYAAESSAGADRGRPDLPAMMSSLCRHAGDCIPGGSFVTFACIVLDPGTGQIQCANAGHPPPIIVDSAGNLRQLRGADNFPLGVCDEPIECHGETLAAGEMLVMFTDGVTDTANPSGEMYGGQQFADSVRSLYAAAKDSSAGAIARELTALLDNFRGGRLPDDDRTFLLVRRV